VEHTPHESSEGGYIYIWGGPYNASEELSDEFGEIVPEDVIEELVEALETQSYEWSGKPGTDDFEDYYFSVVASNTKFHETFTKSLDNIRLLLETEVDPAVQQHFLRLLYVNIITTLETFLSDAFINTVLSNQALVRKFPETNPDFKQRKLSLDEIFSRMENIENEARNYLIDVIWHKLEKIKPMYKAALNIDFPNDLRGIFKAIAIRHDIVHRNGKTKDGKEIELEKGELWQLIDDICNFVDSIDNQFENGEF
jgi:hypothetical protein